MRQILNPVNWLHFTNGTLQTEQILPLRQQSVLIHPCRFTVNFPYPTRILGRSP